MPGKDDIQTPPQPIGAAKVLKGLGGKLAVVVNQIADAFFAEVQRKTEPLAEADKTLRTVTQIARAAHTLHQLQAAEDKADDRARERNAKQAFAAARALQFNPDEDETDMNERDPRLEDPKLMAEADADLERRLAEIGVQLESKGFAGRPAQGNPPEGVGQLVRPEPVGAEAARH